VSQRRFELAAIAAVCITVALVAAHAGLRAGQIALWVAVAAAASVSAVAAYVFAQRFRPEASWVDQTNLAKTLGITIIGVVTTTVGVISGSSALIVWGLVIGAMFGMWEFWIWRRSR
jgi:hypothetical protein